GTRTTFHGMGPSRTRIRTSTNLSCMRIRIFRTCTIDTNTEAQGGATSPAEAPERTSNRRAEAARRSADERAQFVLGARGLIGAGGDARAGEPCEQGLVDLRHVDGVRLLRDLEGRGAVGQRPDLERVP